jgi:hypothetical protein
MRPSLLPIALAATSYFWLGGGYNERYCAYADGYASYESCSYYTLEQCRASVHGVGGQCRVNPRYFEEEPVRRKPRKRNY